MKYTVLNLYVKIFLVIAIQLISVQAYAGMTLFNDVGDWQLGTLGNPEDGNATYRACKNSRDRIKDADNEESLGILCVTYSQESGEINAGIWLDEPRDENSPSVRCNLLFDDGTNFTEFCDIEDATIGKLKIEISDNTEILRKMMLSSSLSIIFENNFVRDGTLSKLDFDIDPKNFARVAPVISEYLKNLN